MFDVFIPACGVVPPEQVVLELFVRMRNEHGQTASVPLGRTLALRAPRYDVIAAAAWAALLKGTVPGLTPATFEAKRRGFEAVGVVALEAHRTAEELTAIDAELAARRRDTELGIRRLG